MKQISTKQLCFIIVITFCIGKLIFMPAVSSGYLEENIWLGLLIIYLIDFILLFFIIKFLIKHQDQTFFEVLVQKFNKPIAKTIIVLYAIFFLVKLVIPILEENFSIELTFYESQPNFLTFFPFFIVVVYVSLKGLNAFARSVELCLWLFISGIIMIILLSFFAGDYTSFFPFFNKNVFDILSNSYNLLLWFGDPIILLLLCGKIKISKNFTKKVCISYAISMLITLTIIIIFYAVFSFIAKRQFYAPLKMSKYSISLTSIGRFDYISCLLLVICSVFQLSMPIVVLSDVLKETFKIKYPFIYPIILTSISCFTTYLLINKFFITLSFIQNYGAIFLVFMTYILPIIIYSYRRKNAI